MRIVDATRIITEIDNDEIRGLEEKDASNINEINSNDNGTSKFVVRLSFEVCLHEWFGPIHITNNKANITGPFTEL